MSLPIPVEFAAMEANTAASLPEGVEWQYEPKWDGFRCLVFRDGEEVELQSKSGQALARYFPEAVSAFRVLRPAQFVLDGELVVPTSAGLDFNLLLQRIHPAASRIAKLASATPAHFIAFDLLVDEEGEETHRLPLEQRRPLLENFARNYFSRRADLHLTPATRDVAVARDWLQGVTADLDGVVAKRADLPYQSGTRNGMLKVKNLRTADCVVGGFRYGQNSDLVGSLLLGLYGEDGLLHHVGFSSGIAAKDKKELTAKLKRHAGGPGFTGHAPGGPSRWATERSTEWQPLRPELVVEVQYDHFSGGRFRHGTKVLRWRPDKSPDQCLMEQVERESRALNDLLRLGA
jgi:ATP-dependent DNA ligase